MGWACNKYGGEETYKQGFNAETWEKETSRKIQS
jgi:hypothetical protein